MSDHIATAEVTADITASQPLQPDADADAGQDRNIEVTAQDLLVEEVSIDGMCGVY